MSMDLSKQLKSHGYRWVGTALWLLPAISWAQTAGDSAAGALVIRDNTRLMSSLSDIYQMLIAVCYITGIIFTFLALYRLKKYGTGSAMMHSPRSMLGPAGLFMIGVILMFTPHFIDIMVMTLWGSDSVMSYQQLSEDASFREIVTPLIGVIQVVGLIAFIRGWVLVSKSTKEGAPPGSISKGVIHVIGGVMAINIVGTIDVVTSTLGQI